MTKKTMDNDQTRQEKAVLVALVDTSKPASENDAERSVEELALLAETAGAQVAGTAIQRKKGADSATFIGKGKVREIREACEELGADLLIFDDELTGSQIRNLEEETGRKVIDRTLLILDIFAKRAQSREGKLQVELAQQKYRYSRLVGLGESLSRLGGGIGTRGPGESKLETDRRHIKRRIDLLKTELSEIGGRRGRIRETRRGGDVPVVAVIGYTNAGKSTLINRLCESDLFAEDMLFATLDATARRLVLPDGQEAVLVDTVGFIRKLPHHLIEAFQSTLEEVTDADIILHVADSQDGDLARHMEIVEEMLVFLNASEKPRITVMNKIDREEQACEGRAPAFNARDGIVVRVSAATGEGIADLQEILVRQIEKTRNRIVIGLPYKDAGVLDFVRKNGVVEEVEYQDAQIRAVIRLPLSKLATVRQYVIK